MPNFNVYSIKKPTIMKKLAFIAISALIFMTSCNFGVCPTYSVNPEEGKPEKEQVQTRDERV